MGICPDISDFSFSGRRPPQSYCSAISSGRGESAGGSAREREPFGQLSGDLSPFTLPARQDPAFFGLPQLRAGATAQSFVSGSFPCEFPLDVPFGAVISPHPFLPKI